MKTTTVIIIIALAVTALILALTMAWIFFYPPVEPVLEPPLLKTPDAVQKITEGTTITDIERDLEMLQNEAILGNLEAQVQQMERELQLEGL
jgi:hypothetical protein